MSEARLDVLLAGERMIPPLGGAERATLEVATALVRAGHRVRCLGLEPEPGRLDAVAAWDRAVARGGEIASVLAPVYLGWHALPQPDHRLAFWDWRARAARAEAVGAGVLAALAARRADVVVTYDTVVPAVTRTAQAFGVPVLVWLHGYETLCHWRFGVDSTCVVESRCRQCPRTLALTEPERAARIAHADGHASALRTAAALVAPSHVVADAAEALCGRRPDVVAPVVAAPSPVVADRDGPVLAISSLWTRDKGVDLLGPIARHLGPRRRLVIQLGDGGRHEPLPAEVARLANVEPRTAPAEIGELLTGAAALVVPSQLPEPWSRLAFEGMAAGVPTLTSDTGGLREFVPLEQRVSPHGDPAAWGAALDRVLDPADWEAARTRGRAAAAAVLGTRPAERAVAVIEAAASSR